MSVRIGVSFDGFIPTREAIALAERAVAAGAKSLWMAEHLGYREAIATCMAFAMKVPDTVLVPTAVSPYLWHAMPTAMAMATLDEAAPACAAIAIGTGNPLFLAESGRAVEKPVRAVREFTEALRKLWAGEAVHSNGEFVRLAGARLAFKPSASIPIYVAAIGPDLARFRRAGYLFFGTSRHRKEALDAVRQKLAFVMRNKFLGANIKASGIAVDQEAVIAAIARRDLTAASALVPDEAVEAFAIAGTPQHCSTRLRDFIDAGLDEPVLGLLGSPENCSLGLDVMRE